MRTFIVGAGILAACLLGAAMVTDAQTVLVLPRESQAAGVTQRLGITDVTIHYSRPLVHGRKIWGGLVPLGEVWRAGANENTTIEFTDPVTVEGKPLDKGTYGLFMIPGENEWTVIFSKNSTSWGQFTYSQAEDALRVAVKSRPSDFHEALTFDFDELAPDSTLVTLRWEKLAVPFRVQVNVNGIAAASLKLQLRAWSRWNWESWSEAADYLVTSKGDLNDALEDAGHSIQLEERFENLDQKSRILDMLGRKEEAAAAHSQALAVANVLQLHTYGRQLQIQGKQKEAFEIFRMNIGKHPGHWVVHSEVSRIACANGDFDKAVAEMKLAAAGAPDVYKPAFEGLVKRLEAKQDINK
ncbi:MAG TPA: DUF2911 domain-containing protein [Candidatus Acidoferrales bacterium]|nr:DUF2911 domain-containing protein [Candidatus Acidoferrales bacterium]